MTNTRQAAYVRFTAAKSPQSEGGEKITLKEAKHILAALISDDGKLDYREMQDAIDYHTVRFGRPSLVAYAKHFIAKFGMKDFERASLIDTSEDTSPVTLVQVPAVLRSALAAAAMAVNEAAKLAIADDALESDPAEYEAPHVGPLALAEVYAADKSILGYTASVNVHFASWDLQIKCAVGPEGKRLFLVTNWD